VLEEGIRLVLALYRNCFLLYPSDILLVLVTPCLYPLGLSLPSLKVRILFLPFLELFIINKLIERANSILYIVAVVN
jgi:hypothetical protein